MIKFVVFYLLLFLLQGNFHSVSARASLQDLFSQSTTGFMQLPRQEKKQAPPQSGSLVEEPVSSVSTSIPPVTVPVIPTVKIDTQDSPSQATHTPQEKKEVPEVELENMVPVGKHNRLETVEQEEASLYLNLQDAQLETVIDFLAKKKEIDIIPHKDLVNLKASLISKEPLTLSQAWDAVHMFLEANGFAIIEINGLYKILPLRDIGRNPLPFYSSSQGVEPEELPESNEIIRYVYFCKNIHTGVAESILGSMLAQGSLQTNPLLGVCIITTKSRDIKSAMKIVKELDQGGLRESIKVVKLSHANAPTVAQLFNEQIIGSNGNQNNRKRFVKVSAKKEVRYFSTETKIIPEPIHNTLILMGTNDNIDKIISFIQKYIDVPIQEAESRIHVKELKYMPAEQVKQLLGRMIQAPRGSKNLIDGQYKYFEDVVLVAEQARDQNGQGRGSGNRLIVSCNNEDWHRLERFIDTLDQPQPQVAIEIMIVDLSNEDERALGAELRNKENMFMRDLDARTSHLASITDGDRVNFNLTPVAQAVGATGATILSLGNAQANDVWGIIQSVYKLDHSNIISQPFLIANNNTTTTEEFALSRLVDGALTSTGSSNIQIVNQEHATARTEATVTPRVNAAGIIDLEISMKIEEFATQNGTDPDTINRAINTRVSMATGEVLILGGLTTTKHSNSNWKTPILGDIPLFGNFFKNRSQTETKKNLYVFVRPSIVRPHFEGAPDDYTQFKLDYAKYQLIKNDPFVSRDPVQRWFFKPYNQTVKQRLSDVAEGRVRLIDDYVGHKHAPKQVHISKDPYFRVNVNQATNQRTVSTGYKHYQPDEQTLTMPTVTPEEDAVAKIYNKQLLLSESDEFSKSIQHLEKRSSLISR